MSQKNVVFSYFIISILLVLTGCIFQSSFNTITYLTIIQLLTILFSIKASKKFMSVGTIFIILLYIFHCSQAIITTFGFEDPYFHRSVIARSQDNEFLRAELYVLISMAFWGLFYLLTIMEQPVKKNIARYSYDEIDELYLKRLFSTAFVIFILCFLPLLYTDMQKILALKTGGYMDTYSTYREGNGKYLSLIGKFARPAISLMILGLCHKPKKARIALLISTIYFGIMMLSGDRGTNMIYIITNIYIYCRFVAKPKFKSVLIAVVIGYFFLGFVSAISLFRYSDFSFDSLLHVFDLRSNDGIIYSLLREFGGTMISLVYSMRFIPEYSGFNYGMTYISSVLLILPKLPQSVVNELSNNFAFTSVFPTAYQDSLGGSVLGELYYNYGWIGAPITSIIGIAIARIDVKIDLSENNNDWMKIGMLVSFLPQLFLWVRDYFSGVLFIGFWMSVILYFSFRKKDVLKNGRGE